MAASGIGDNLVPQPTYYCHDGTHVSRLDGVFSNMETENEMQIYSLEEVQKHSKNLTSTPPSYWIVIHNKVYDVTTWLDDHPGGDEILMDNSGTDATEPWEDIGHSTEARGKMKKYLIAE